MHLENLRLLNFKNYAESEINFTSDVNCLAGDNGSGKTNLLDAIHYLSITKSAFNSVDIQNIRHNESYFSITGTFVKEDQKHAVRCSLVRGEKKKVFHGKKQIEKASDHIGQFPVILIAPNDNAIILEGSETRRKFFDSLLSQLDKEYLESLIEYNQALKRRNLLLKQMSEKGKTDQALLEPYDNLLINKGKALEQKRRQFCHDFAPSVLYHYEDISEGKESISLKYQSTFSDEDYYLIFKNALKKDLALERTTVGVHRDDFAFEISGYPLKKFGSQGQQKSFLIALKLAQFDVLKQNKGLKPIVLLDDIFDKLDDHRIVKLMSMIANGDFGQVFITDARPERTQNFVKDLNCEVKLFTVDQGTVTQG